MLRRLLLDFNDAWSPSFRLPEGAIPAIELRHEALLLSHNMASYNDLGSLSHTWHQNPMLRRASFPSLITRFVALKSAVRAAIELGNEVNA
jgi:hypothetical protein